MIMDYDLERTFIKASCVEYDVEPMFKMMLDAALEPRTDEVANIARVKNLQAHGILSGEFELDPH